MAPTSKELLHLEKKNLSTSSIESALLIRNDKDTTCEKKHPPSDGKPLTSQVPKSQVLGQVKDFLGVISEANKELQANAKDNAAKYDIEVLNGNESEIIEMDLMLGVADLHTPEAVAAAESALAGYQPVIPLGASTSGKESDTSSSDDDDDEYDDDDDDVESDDGFIEVKKSKLGKDDLGSTVGTNRSSKKQQKKRPKVVELS